MTTAWWKDSSPAMVQAVSAKKSRCKRSSLSCLEHRSGSWWSGILIFFILSSKSWIYWSEPTHVHHRRGHKDQPEITGIHQYWSAPQLRWRRQSPTCPANLTFSVRNIHPVVEGSNKDAVTDELGSFRSITTLGTTVDHWKIWTWRTGSWNEKPRRIYDG